MRRLVPLALMAALTSCQATPGSSLAVSGPAAAVPATPAPASTSTPGGTAPPAGTPAPVLAVTPPARTMPASASGGAGPTGDVAPPEPYRDLGKAHYEGKSLFDVEGEFDQLTIAPSGSQVAFRGREDRDNYVLFVAPLDGTIRLLGPTPREPAYLRWANDERQLIYLTTDVSRAGMAPDAPPDVPGMPVGQSIQLQSVADGTVRIVAALPGMGVFFPSPTLELAAIYGFAGMGGSKLGAPFDLIDVATGTRRPLSGGIQEVYTTYAVAWRSDGQALAVCDALPPPSQGLRVLTYAAPDWSPVERSRALSWPGQVWWGEDADVLETYHVSAAPELVLERVTAQGALTPFRTVPLDRPPANYAYHYGLMLPSPHRQRFMTRREATSTLPQLLAVEAAPAPVNLLIERTSGRATPIAPGLTVVGWLDDTHLLAYGGQDQRKRLQVVPLG